MNFEITELCLNCEGVGADITLLGDWQGEVDRLPVCWGCLFGWLWVKKHRSEVT